MCVQEGRLLIYTSPPMPIHVLLGVRNVRTGLSEDLIRMAGQQLLTVL